MTDTAFDALVRLAQTDISILECKKNISRAVQRNVILLEQKKELQQSIDTEKQSVHAFKKLLDSYELESKVLRNQESTLKNRLLSVASPKEYFSLEGELKTVVFKLNINEDLMLGTLTQLEKAEDVLADIASKGEKEVPILHHALHNEEALIAAQEKKLYEYEALRSVALKRIPTEWHDRYISMREKVENPIVSLSNNCCDACRYELTVGDIQTLKRHVILNCRSCYRLLYTL